MRLELYKQADDYSETALNAIGRYEGGTELDPGGIHPAKVFTLFAYASEGLGMVLSGLTEIALAAEEEPGNETFEGEVKRLSKVVRKSGLLFLNRDLTTQIRKSAKTM